MEFRRDFGIPATSYVIELNRFAVDKKE